MKEQTFEEEVLNYYKFLYFKAFKLTKERESALDLVHDTIIRAYDNKEKFVHKTSLGGWLADMQKNLHMNNVRRLDVASRYVDTHHKIHFNFVEYNMGERMISQQEVDSILDKNLNKNLRETFDLFQNDYEYHEIAEKMEIPIGTVKSRLNSTRKILKNLF